MIDAVIKHTSLKDRASYEKMGADLIEPNGEINKQSIDAQLTWYKSFGTVIPPDDKLYDESLRIEVLKEVGRYDYKLQ